MKAVLFMPLILLSAACAAQGAQLSKSYSYFSIGGSNLDEIEQELDRNGPNVGSTGQRHPGATRMEFNTKLTWKEKGDTCRMSAAHVTLKVKVILPRWKPGSKTDSETRFVWNTLAADIKRHEESHVIIAKNHARELEDALRKVGPYKSCAQVKQRAALLTKRILDKHERAQQRFDRIESAGFEKRLQKLLEYRWRKANDS
ncbi:MAG: DUF922 domain-containing protein [Rhizobiaceae bacterium]|nr:DUF922 domain-containing protein [Rhizobiaceae bacterium]